MKCDVCGKKVKKTRSNIALCEECEKLPFASIYEKIQNKPEPQNIHLEEHYEPRVVKPILERYSERIISDVLENACVVDVCAYCEANADVDLIDFKKGS